MTPFSPAILLILTWGQKYFENEGAEEQRDILKQGIRVAAAQKKISCKSLSAFFDKKEWLLKAPLTCNFISKLFDFLFVWVQRQNQGNDTHYNFCCVKVEGLEVVLPEGQ